MPVCGSDGPAFAFIEKSNTRYAVTTDISLGQDAFIQFDFSASCSVTNSCYCKQRDSLPEKVSLNSMYTTCCCFLNVFLAVELEYSLDLGLTWQPVVRDCLPTSPDCSSYTLQRLLVSDTYNKWGRVTLHIPSYARSALLLLSVQYDNATNCKRNMTIETAKTVWNFFLYFNLQSMLVLHHLP